MDKKLSERRLAENQVIFRQTNEQVPKELQAVKSAAESEGRGALVGDIDTPLHFYCECSDENCRQRIVMKPSKYDELHQNSAQFILVPGHHIPQIERIMFEGDSYIVVQKYNTPPKAEKLNSTNIDNSNS